MGEANEQLNLAAQPPAIILMAGLQGAGKTTTVGKLAKLLKERSDRRKCWSSVPTSIALRRSSSWKPWQATSASTSFRVMPARNRSISPPRPSIRRARSSMTL
ncbi:hypothetical protein ACLK2B_13870 [Escherichia coli]